MNKVYVVQNIENDFIYGIFATLELATASRNDGVSWADDTGILHYDRVITAFDVISV